MTKGFSMERPLSRLGGDGAFLAALALIVGLGLANLYSASYGYAASLGLAPSYFVTRQLVWVLVSGVVFLAASIVSFDFLARNMSLIVLSSIFLLVLPFIPGIGITKNGASRWFGFGGQSFQPSELFKPVLVLYLAYILTKKAERLRDIVNGVIPPFIVVLVGVLIVLEQNDFSTAMVLGFLAVIMFWIADVPLVFFAALASVGVPLVSLAVLTSDYRLRRVIGFIAPGYDPADVSYQVNGSLRAIRAGGFWGRGIGQGSLKIRSILQVQADFVFASWVEETGFAGVVAFAALWAALLWRAFKASFESTDPFKSHLAFGLGCYLGLQTLLNIMVVSGAVPATGLPLPFFSAGGSSLVSVALAAGLIYNVSRDAAGSDRRSVAA